MKLTPQNTPEFLRLNAQTYPHMAELLESAAKFIEEAYTPGYRVFEYDSEWVAIPTGDARLQHISGCSENAVGALHECIIAEADALEIMAGDSHYSNSK